MTTRDIATASLIFLLVVNAIQIVNCKHEHNATKNYDSKNDLKLLESNDADESKGVFWRIGNVVGKISHILVPYGDTVALKQVDTIDDFTKNAPVHGHHNHHKGGTSQHARERKQHDKLKTHAERSKPDHTRNHKNHKPKKSRSKSSAKHRHKSKSHPKSVKEHKDKFKGKTLETGSKEREDGSKNTKTRKNKVKEDPASKAKRIQERKQEDNAILQVLTQEVRKQMNKHNQLKSKSHHHSKSKPHRQSKTRHPSKSKPHHPKSHHHSKSKPKHHSKSEPKHHSKSKPKHHSKSKHHQHSKPHHHTKAKAHKQISESELPDLDDSSEKDSWPEIEPKAPTRKHEKHHSHSSRKHPKKTNIPTETQTDSSKKSPGESTDKKYAISKEEELVPADGEKIKVKPLCRDTRAVSLPTLGVKTYITYKNIRIRKSIPVRSSTGKKFFKFQSLSGGDRGINKESSLEIDIGRQKKLAAVIVRPVTHSGQKGLLKAFKIQYLSKSDKWVFLHKKAVRRPHKQSRVFELQHMTKANQSAEAYTAVMPRALHTAAIRVYPEDWTHRPWTDLTLVFCTHL